MSTNGVIEKPLSVFIQRGPRSGEFRLHLGKKSWRLSRVEVTTLVGSGKTCLDNHLYELMKFYEDEHKKSMGRLRKVERGYHSDTAEDNLSPVPTPVHPIFEAHNLRAKVLAYLKQYPGVWNKWNPTLLIWAASFLPGVPTSTAKERVRLALAQIIEACDDPNKAGPHGGHVEVGKYRFRWVPGPMAHLCKCNHKKEDHDSGTGLCRQSVGRTGRRCACRDFRSRT